MERKITIQGVEYPVVFNMKTVMNFEEIANKSFLGNDFVKTSDRIALVLASVMAADEKTNLTIETIVGNGDWESLKAVNVAFNDIMEDGLKWFGIPKVIEEVQPESTPGEEAKN